MINTRCIICNENSKSINVYIRAQDIGARSNILKCQRCGLVFFDNDSFESLDDSYWDNSGEFDIYEKDEIFSEFQQEFRNSLSTIESICKQKGKLLDVGCGIGRFLQLAHRSGWEVFGVEISHPAAEYAKSKLLLNVFEGTVEKCGFSNSYFDVITMWDVIEHIQNPLEALAAIKNKLKPKGVLVIKAPNEKSLFRFLSMAIYRLTFRKIPLFLKYVYYSPHYFYYDKKTLVAILKHFGFRILKIEYDETNINFAKGKINLYFKDNIIKKVVLFCLPLVFLLSRLLGIQNKIIVYVENN